MKSGYSIKRRKNTSKGKKHGNSFKVSSRKCQMMGRKWEEFDTDCLVNILGRLGVESLLLDVPFVCKSWYKATLDPLCWQQIHFPKRMSQSRLMSRNTGGDCEVAGLVKFVVSRSQRSATSVVLHDICTEKELMYISDECPSLKYLSWSSNVSSRHRDVIPRLISKWKSLEILSLESVSNLEAIFSQISLHCKNFVGLCMKIDLIRTHEASTIVSIMPNIKYLNLSGAILRRKNLVMILKGCKELVQLDVRNCTGFDEDDDEILALASKIKCFRCEGSKDDGLEYEDMMCSDYDESYDSDDSYEVEC